MDLRRPMLLSSTRSVPAGGEWVLEPKWDGYRFLWALSGDDISCWTRHGNRHDGKTFSMKAPALDERLLQRRRPVAAVRPGRLDGLRPGRRRGRRRCGSGPPGAHPPAVASEDEVGVWVITSRGFFSVVQDDADSSRVLVRPRVREDLERLGELLPHLDPWHDPTADYAWRALVERSEWGRALGVLTNEIDYRKSSRSPRSGLESGSRRASADPAPCPSSRFRCVRGAAFIEYATMSGWTLTGRSHGVSAAPPAGAVKTTDFAPC